MAAACFPRLRRDKDIAAVSLHLRLVPLGAQLGDIKRRRSGVLSSSIDNRRLGPMLGPWEMTKRRPLRRANGCADVSSHAGIMGRWSFVPNWERDEGGKEPPFDRLRIIYRSPLRGTRFSRPPPSQRNSFSCSGGSYCSRRDGNARMLWDERWIGQEFERGFEIEKMGKKRSN